MLLAIKGEINNVYKLHKPDCNTIKKYLNGISHASFKKQADAYNWVKIKAPTEILRFRDCIKKLKELGIIPENEVVNSTSPIQNIEDDKERNEYYAKRKLEKAKEKEKKKLERVAKRESEKNYEKIYATEEPETIKTMPGEFVLDRYDMSLQDNARSYFFWYMTVGGGNMAFGDFKGKVLQIEKSKILFKRIYISFEEWDNVIEGKEDHVWIYDIDEFIKMGIKVGDCIKFTALVYAYKRRDGSIDFGLKTPQWIQYIHDYEIPSDDELLLQSIGRIVCETCIYSEHCYGGFCIAAPGYKEVMTIQLLAASGASDEFIEGYALKHHVSELTKKEDVDNETNKEEEKCQS